MNVYYFLNYVANLANKFYLIQEEDKVENVEPEKKISEFKAPSNLAAKLFQFQEEDFDETNKVNPSPTVSPLKTPANLAAKLFQFQEEDLEENNVIQENKNNITELKTPANLAAKLFQFQDEDLAPVVHTPPQPRKSVEMKISDKSKVTSRLKTVTISSGFKNKENLNVEGEHTIVLTDEQQPNAITTTGILLTPFDPYQRQKSLKRNGDEIDGFTRFIVRSASGQNVLDHIDEAKDIPDDMTILPASSSYVPKASEDDPSIIINS